MSDTRELKREELVFGDILEEISTLVFGDWYEDIDGNYYSKYYTDDDQTEYSENPLIEHIETVFNSGGDEDYLYMNYIFKYKGKFYSITKNENSYEDDGFETDTLKEVHPKEVSKTIYE